MRGRARAFRGEHPEFSESTLAAPAPNKTKDFVAAKNLIKPEISPPQKTSDSGGYFRQAERPGRGVRSEFSESMPAGQGTGVFRQGLGREIPHTSY